MDHTKQTFQQSVLHLLKLNDVNIKTSLTPKKGERKLDVAIEVQNNHQDHYLKALFPTGIGGADEVCSGG